MRATTTGDAPQVWRPARGGRPFRLVAACGIALTLFGAACASDDDDPTIGASAPPAEATASVGGTPAVAGTPKLEITAPTEGATVQAGEVMVTLAVENFNVVNKLGQDPVPGEGHVHFYIDVDSLPTTPGKPAVTADAKTYHAAATTTHTWPGVTAGEHTLSAQLVNNNHTPLEPPITATIKVTVQ